MRMFFKIRYCSYTAFIHLQYYNYYYIYFKYYYFVIMVLLLPLLLILLLLLLLLLPFFFRYVEPIQPEGTPFGMFLTLGCCELKE